MDNKEYPFQRQVTVTFFPEEPLTRFVESTGIPSVASQLADMRRLPQPRGSPALERYYAAYELGVAELKRDPGLVVRRRIPPAFEQSNRIAIDLGMPQCVR